MEPAAAVTMTSARGNQNRDGSPPHRPCLTVSRLLIYVPEPFN